MTAHTPMPNLRTLLRVDAATCATMGALLALGAGPIAAVTAIPEGLLGAAGVALLPIAAFMAAVAQRAAPWRPGAWLVVGGNALWVLGSLALMAGNWIAPNTLGHVFIAAQAMVVAALTVAETGALRRRIAAAA